MKIHIIHSKHLCAHCHTQRALFNTSRDIRFRARNDHDLCSRCYRVYQSAFPLESREHAGWLDLVADER